MLRLALPLLLSVSLAACQTAAPEPATRAQPVPVTERPQTIPENACWSTDRIPAVTETVFVEVSGQTGLQPREHELEPARDRLFAVLCPEQIAPDTVATLQRALTARGFYAGAISGDWDTETSEAVRRYQAPQGLNSGVLSLEAAQRLGLVVLPRESL